MADLIIVYWRDIPAQVIVKKGRQNAKRELPLRFTEAIDMCAMRTGAADTDDYLAEWRKADPDSGRRRSRSRGRQGAGRLRCEATTGSALSRWSRQAAGKMADTPISTTAAGPADGARESSSAGRSQGRTQATIVKKTAPKTDYKPSDVSPQRRVSVPMRSGSGRCAIRACSNGFTPSSPTCS